MIAVEEKQLRFGLPAECIQDIRAVFERHPAVEKVMLFGSRAIGNYREGSDIDLAVVGQYLTHDDLLSIRAGLDELPYAYTYDVLNYAKISNPDVVAHIDDLGIVFFEKESTDLLPGWTQYKLEDVLDKLIDYRGKTPQKSTSGIPLVTAKVVKDGRIETPNEFIPESEYENWMTRGIPKFGDVILTTEAPLGEVAQLKTNDKIALAQRIITLRGKSGVIDNTFLKYFLQSPVGQNNLKSRETGSTVTGIKQSELREVSIHAPDLPTQRAIAAILANLDDKIELNLRLNQTLERLAQTLFEEWFVKFNFPGFDGEWVDGLPKGWRKGKVSDVSLANSNTLSAKDKFDEIKYIEISEVNRGIINEISIYPRGEEPSRARRKLQHGDVVVSTVRPNRGSYFLALSPERNLIVSTGFAVFSPTKVPYSFLYTFLTSDENLDYYGRVADGGAYPAINPSVISEMEIIIPTKLILDSYHEVASGFFEKMKANLLQNQTLTTLRDTLLPRLMSGQIQVPV